jgi:hypothetical protein
MRVTSEPHGEITVEGTDDYDPVSQVNRATWFISTSAQRDAWVVPLHLRSIFPQESFFSQRTDFVSRAETATTPVVPSRPRALGKYVNVNRSDVGTAAQQSCADGRVKASRGLHAQQAACPFVAPLMRSVSESEDS